MTTPETVAATMTQEMPDVAARPKADSAALPDLHWSDVLASISEALLVFGPDAGGDFDELVDDIERGEPDSDTADDEGDDL